VRALILDATEQIMLEEGYAGVSSRKVSARAGLKSKLLHYYFRTMDDLFIAAFQRLEDGYEAFQRLEDGYDERFARAAASDRPLHDLWKLEKDGVSAKLILEFTALASHRPPVREVIARSARRDRTLMTAALGSVFTKYDIDQDAFSPKVIALLMAGLTRALSTELALGSEEGHEEALAFVARLIARFEAAGGASEKLKPRSRSQTPKRSGTTPGPAADGDTLFR
jgi:AcrR family transcriptional regulator